MAPDPKPTTDVALPETREEMIGLLKAVDKERPRKADIARFKAWLKKPGVWRLMGDLVNRRVTTIIAWGVATLIILLNVYLLYQTLFGG